jgi:hypothetical protein
MVYNNNPNINIDTLKQNYNALISKRINTINNQFFL